MSYFKINLTLFAKESESPLGKHISSENCQLQNKNVIMGAFIRNLQKWNAVQL